MGNLSEGKRTIVKKRKLGILVSVKRAIIIRSKNGALLAPEKGHSQR